MAKFEMDFFDSIINEQTGKPQKGLMNINIRNLLFDENTVRYTIPLKYRYRPDLIAKEFYGTHHLQWMITYFNNFNNSPEDYYSSRVIELPSFEKVNSELF